MIPDEKLKEMARQLEPVIGFEPSRALWLRYITAKTPEKKERFRQRIRILGESMLNLYKEKILLPPPEKKAVEGEIPIGKVSYNEKELHDFKIKKQDLIRHVAVFGKTGSGKTNLAFSMIKSLLDQKTPFIVFDWKRNFRDLIKIPAFKGKIKIFTVGRDVLPFYFNPKNCPRNCDEEVYQKKFIEIINWAYFLGHGANDALMEAYEQGNFQEMKEYIEKQRKRGREMLWWQSGKRTLNAITWGGLGRMVSHPKPLNMRKLLKQNIVLELDGLTESDKCFVIGSMLNWIQEYRRAQTEREVVKHCLIVEEAHHLFRRKPQTRQEDITDIIFREVREYGEGIIILDQHPHKTSVQALGNANIRIAMQTDLKEDRKALAGCMMIKKDQEEWLGKLQVGEAIVKTGSAVNPFLIKIPKFKIAKGVTTDQELKNAFRKKPKQSDFAAPPTPEVATQTI
tara:strand:+ start:1579 stop:2940 length:1362 start_codon:yes stop_codon:yes gene_type:complete